MMRVVILAPIDSSPYARLLAHQLSTEPGITLAHVIVRTPWTIGRIRSEFRRDGMRLIRKAYKKLWLRNRAYNQVHDTIIELSRVSGLPGRTVDDVARVHGFPVTVVRDHNDSASLEALAAARPDVVAFTGGGLLRKQVLSVPRLGVLNCHMGVLPAYRGMDVVEWPFLEHSPEQAAERVGLTVHFMDPGVDTGPILLRRPVPVEPGDTFTTIRQRMEPRMVLAMLDTIRGLRDENLTAAAQNACDGRQYYVMHPRVQECANRRLGCFEQSHAREPDPIPEKMPC